MQMQEKIGVERIEMQEPYLPLLLKEREVAFLRALERLFDSVDKLPLETPAKSMAVDGCGMEVKAINPKQPILPQIEERLDIETSRHARHTKQGLDQHRQQAFGIRKYIWRTAGDDRVRSSHAVNEGRVFEWGDGEDPGEAINCRCTAEPIVEDAGEPIYDPPIEPVYPELILLPLIRLRTVAAGILERVAAKHAARQAAERAARDAARKPKPTPSKPSEAPKPPAKPKPDISKRPEGVPKDWKAKPTEKGGGVVYEKPGSKGGTYVKVQKGNPNSSNPGQRYDNVRVTRDGKSLDKNGNVVPKKSQESHIPLEDFKFDSELFQ